VCGECDDRLKCTGNIDGKGRHIFLLSEPQQKIQTQVRKDQKTSDWQRRYVIRAGCEATVSETVHAHGLRHCRYRGLAKTHVQHVLTAAGANVIRLSEHWPPGTAPASPPRPPRLPAALPKAPHLEITNSIRNCRPSSSPRRSPQPWRPGSVRGRSAGPSAA